MTQFSVTGGAFYQCVAVSTSADATGSYRRFCLPVHRLQRLPQGRRLARRLLHLLQHVQRRGHGLPRRPRVRPRPEPDDHRRGHPGRPSVLPALDELRRPAARRPRRRAPTARGRAQLLRGLRRRNVLQLWKFHVDWATPANSTFTGPTNIAGDRLQRGLRRRHLHPAAEHDAAARLARRPPDVPPGLPQLRHPRVAGHQPLGDRRARPPRACAGTSSATPAGTPTRLPAGHLLARRDLPLDGLDRHGPAGQHAAGLQRLEQLGAAQHPDHRARRPPTALGTMQAETHGHRRASARRPEASAAGATTAR